MAIPTDLLLQEDFDFPINEANLDQVRALQSRLPFLGQQRSIYGGGSIGSGGLNFTGYTPQYSSMVGPIATGQAYAQSIAGGMPMSQVIAPGVSYSPDVPGGYTQADLNVVNLPRDVAPVFPEAPTTGEVFQPSYPTMPYAPVGTPMPTKFMPPMAAQPSMLAPTIFGQTVPSAIGDLFENQGFLDYLNSLDLDVSGIQNYLADQGYMPEMTPETSVMPTITPTVSPEVYSNLDTSNLLPEEIFGEKFYPGGLIPKYITPPLADLAPTPAPTPAPAPIVPAPTPAPVDVQEYLREQKAKEQEQMVAENLANIEASVGPLPRTDVGDINVNELLQLYSQQKAVEEAAKAAAEEQARADAYAKMAVVKPTLMPTMQPQSRSVMPKIPSFFNLV